MGARDAVNSPEVARRANLLSLALVVAAFVVAAAFYDRLPQRVPSHWNLAGRVNGYVSKPWGPFIVPLTMAGIYLLFTVVGRRALAGARAGESAAGARAIAQAAVLAFMFALSIVGLLAGVGRPVSMNRVVTVGLGLLFVVVGAVMDRFPRNLFVGIRTPWTLASDEVWRRTHRLGGKVWVVGGLVMLAGGLWLGGIAPLLVVLPVVVLVPVVYSYVVHRRLRA